MTQAHILIIEDNTVLCDVLVRNLCAREYLVSVAHDVAGALNALKTSPIDLLLLDINLPDQTGWDLLRAVQASTGIQLRQTADGRLPVVVLSAVRVHHNRLAEFRPLAYLVKPFPLDALLRLVAQATSRQDTTPEKYLSTG